MHSNTPTTRNLPTTTPPSANNQTQAINLAAINALKTLRFALTQKMNTCKDPVEARRLGETYRQVNGTVELIAGWL